MAVRLWDVVGTLDGVAFGHTVMANTAQEAIGVASDALATGEVGARAEVTSVRLIATTTKEPAGGYVIK